MPEAPCRSKSKTVHPEIRADKFSQGYGMTEAGGVTATSFEWDHFLDGDKSKLLASAGKPAFCAEINIFDDQDNPLRPVKSARSLSGKTRHDGILEESGRRKKLFGAGGIIPATWDTWMKTVISSARPQGGHDRHRR
jgi:acyl-CoA synthetase (AMP-forming)/AMP-acid ligase II